MQPDCRCTRDEPFLLFMYATSGAYAMPILKSGDLSAAPAVEPRQRVEKLSI
jgi:hypothetical protein